MTKWVNGKYSVYCCQYLYVVIESVSELNHNSTVV